MLTINDFNVGDKVMFGRGQGEKTLAKVVKVNRKKLKVEQLEVRGTRRTYPVGTIWTVPPSLCDKVDSKGTTTTPKRTHTPRQTPRQILAAKGIKRGDRVDFNFRKCDGVLTGTIVRINSKRVTIEDVNSSKYPRGVYANPRSIIRKVGTAAPAKKAAKKATPKLTLSLGQTVEFEGFSWAAKGTATIKGVVTRRSRSKGTYEVYGEGRTHNLTPDQVKAVASRSDDIIVSECMSVYSSLSPENLTHDGERSRSQIKAAAARLNRALKALWKEAGREIGEDECYRAWDNARKA